MAKVTDIVYDAIYPCTACALRQEGNRGPTGCTGPERSPLMIVGEGPGAVEDEYGVPLVGQSGRLLDRALASVGISRERVYVTNVVKCRPRGNRTPTPAEGAYCAERWLVREIAALKPAVIVALGKVALRFFAPQERSIVRSRGSWRQWQAADGTVYPVLPTFHPAYLLRLSGREEREAKWQVYYDLTAAKERASAAAPDFVWQVETPADTRAPFLARREARRSAGR